MEWAASGAAEGGENEGAGWNRLRAAHPRRMRPFFRWLSASEWESERLSAWSPLPPWLATAPDLERVTGPRGMFLESGSDWPFFFVRGSWDAGSSAGCRVFQ